MTKDIPPSGIYTKVAWTMGGYYVFWETTTAYGSKGHNMTKEDAEELEREIQERGHA